MLKADVKRRWIERLESGEIPQHRGGWGGDGMCRAKCCLQVLREDVLGLGGDTDYFLDLEDVGLERAHADECIRMNDQHRLSFREIAAWIKRNVAAEAEAELEAA